MKALSARHITSKRAFDRARRLKTLRESDDSARLKSRNSQLYASIPNYFSLILNKSTTPSNKQFQPLLTQRHLLDKRISFYHADNSSISEEDSVRSSPDKV